MNNEITREDFSPNRNVRICNQGCRRKANFGVGYGGTYYESRCQYHIRDPEISVIIRIPEEIQWHLRSFLVIDTKIE